MTLLFILTMAINPSVDSDTWWHLRAGEEILDRGEILKTDPFSLTRQGEPWIYPGWLSQITLHTIYTQFSFAGVNIFTGLMIFIAFVFVWRVLDGKELLKAFILIIAVATSSVYWSARPQIISFALSGATIFLLERARNGKVKLLWFLPLVFILWVNVHGGFAIGFILLGLYLVSDLIDLFIEMVDNQNPSRRLWQDHKQFVTTGFFIGLVSLAAVSINPHGPSMLLYPLKTISIQTLQDYIAEWQSPNFHGRETWPFLAMFFLTWISLAITREKIVAVDILVPLVIGYMSLTTARNISIFALATLPILFRHSNSIVENILSRRRRGDDFPESIIQKLNWTLLILFLIAASLKITRELPDSINQEKIEDQMPLEAFDLIESERYSGELFNSYNWGGYVVWRLYPNYLSFVDGRTDLFGDEILGQYFKLWLAEAGWEEELESWKINLVLVEPHAPLAHELQGIGWITRFEDDKSVLLTSPSR
jgi:hypothetical protein